jgi:hypothetical protein
MPTWQVVMPAEDLWEGEQRQVAVFLLGHDDDGGAAGNERDRLSVLDRGVLDLLHRRLGLLRSPPLSASLRAGLMTANHQNM